MAPKKSSVSTRQGIDYQPPTSAELCGNGESELVMFVIILLALGAVVTKMKIGVWFVVFASISYWTSTCIGADNEQRSILSIAGFIVLGLVSVYMGPSPITESKIKN